MCLPRLTSPPLWQRAGQAPADGREFADQAALQLCKGQGGAVSFSILISTVFLMENFFDLPIDFMTRLCYNINRAEVENCNLCGCSSSGRAPPCQGGGSEFEPRHPLQKSRCSFGTAAFPFIASCGGKKRWDQRRKTEGFCGSGLFFRKVPCSKCPPVI